MLRGKSNVALIFITLLAAIGANALVVLLAFMGAVNSQNHDRWSFFDFAPSLIVALIDPSAIMLDGTMFASRSLDGCTSDNQLDCLVDPLIAPSALTEVAYPPGAPHG
jgi:hypothetical protein